VTVLADTRLATAATVGRFGPLVAVLSLVVLTVSILQTSVVPVLDVIGRQPGASADAVSWVVTANLLAAAASTPLIGRLADLRDKKRMLLARVLQGTAFSLYPRCRRAPTGRRIHRHLRTGRGQRPRGYLADRAKTLAERGASR